MRPTSILRFEYAYLGSVLLWCINAALGWQSQVAMVKSGLAAAPPMVKFGEAMLLGTTLLGLFLSLLLWYFTARRASEVAKWIVTLYFVLTVVSLPMSLSGFQTTPWFTTALTVATFILHAIAVWMLFRPDARAWFRAEAGADEPDPLA